MMVGNPYKFSILASSIAGWNIDQGFCNGLLIFWVDGTFFPKEAVTATLKCELPPLIERLHNISVDRKLYSMEKNDAFIEIYNLTFPEDFEIKSDERFDITPSSLSDHHCFIFAVGNGDHIRILAGMLRYNLENGRHDLENLHICEAFVTREELEEMLSGFEEAVVFAGK